MQLKAENASYLFMHRWRVVDSALWDPTCRSAPSEGEVGGGWHNAKRLCMCFAAREKHWSWPTAGSRTSPRQCGRLRAHGRPVGVHLLPSAVPLANKEAQFEARRVLKRRYGWTPQHLARLETRLSRARGASRHRHP